MATPVDVTCRHCLGRFKADRSLKGGITNCPRCGKATSVSGGPEPLFWVLLSGAVLVVLALATLASAAAGPAGALIVLIVGAIIIAVAVAAS